MKEITVSITEEQERFLKMFAEKHFHGAYDNRFVRYPIHVVQTKRYRYVPFSKDIAGSFSDHPLSFTTDFDYDIWYSSELEAIKDWYQGRGIKCPIPLRSFEVLEGQFIRDVNGNQVIITDYEDYFQAYGVRLQALAWKEEYYESIAPFFILEEANRYMKYQGHNLHEPRVYTYGTGYGDQGEYIHFWELLMSIGQKLNGEKSEAIYDKRNQNIS